MEQNRPRKKTHLMWSMIFLTKIPGGFNGKRKLFLNEMLLDSWICTMWERNEHEVSPHTISKITHKWIIGLSVKAETIKLLEEAIGKNFCNLGVGKNI